MIEKVQEGGFEPDWRDKRDIGLLDHEDVKETELLNYGNARRGDAN